MKLKRIMAGILASAITVTSLSVYGFAQESYRFVLNTTQAEDTTSDEESEPEVQPEPQELFEYVEQYGEISIVKYIGEITDVVIPSEIDGKPVTGIAKSAFEGNANIVSVVIPDSMLYIGSRAFNKCINMRTVSFGNSVINIDANSFEGCTALTSVVIPDSVEVIGTSAFSKCSELKNVVIGSGVGVIRNGAFNECISLNSVQIGPNVTDISNVFTKCSSLETVEIPDSVIKMANAFKDCYYLKSVTIGKGVAQIGGFSGCSSLTDIVISPDNKADALLDSGFSDCVSLESFVIPSTITKIGNNCFKNCSSLKEATIPNAVVSIGSSAYENCTSLETVSIGNGCTAIGGSAFRGCSELTDATIGTSVKTIGKLAFGHCKKLTSVTIPKTVTTISEQAFGYQMVGNEYFTIKDFMIYCYKDSAAETYAIKNGFNYELLLEAPANVTGVNAASGTTDIKLSWDVNPDATGYIVYWFKDGNWEKLSEISGKENTSFKISGLTPLTKYSFRVQCYKTEGVKTVYSGYTTLDTYTLPNEITGVKASSKDSEVTLSWKGSDVFSEYVIEQFVDDKWNTVATITDNKTTSYRINKLTPGTKYQFRISGVCKIGTDVVNSNYVEISISTKPTGMKGFKLGGRTDSVLRLNWTKNASATGYIIEQYKGNKWVRIAKITDNATTTYRVTGLSASTRYAFRIQAYKEIGTGAVKSAYTNKLVAYTNPKAMSGFKASAKTKSTITLSWAKNTTATGYIIEQYKGNKWVRIAKIEKNTTVSYKVTGLKANTRYAFRIQAYKNIPGSAVRTAFTNKLVVYTTK